MKTFLTRRRRHLAVGLLALTATPVALADTSSTAAADVSEPTILDPIAVTGETRGSPTQADPLAAARALGRIPGNVSVIERESLENRFALSLRDVLGDQPGVFAQQRYGEEVRLSIRGSGLSRNFHLRGIQLFLDDIPLNLADGAGDFQEIDPAALRHVEVYRGANALPLGVAALGGAVRFISPTGRTQGAPLRGSLEAGSFGTRRLHAALAQAADRHDFYVATTLNRSDGERRQSDRDSQRLSANWGIAHGDDIETRIYLNHQQIDQEVPGTLTRDALRANREQAATGNEDAAAARDVDSTRIALRHARPLGAGQLVVSGYGFTKHLFHPLGFGVIEQDGDVFGASARWASAQWTLGLQWREGVNDAFIFANEGGGTRGFRFADGEEIARHVSIFGQGRWPISNRLDLLGGVLLSRDDRDFVNRRDATESDGAVYEGISPSLGLLYQPHPQATLFANVSRAYEPPTFSELNQSQTGGAGFVALDAQTSVTAEVGSRGQWGAFRWDLAMYRAQLRDELVAFRPAEQDPQIPAATFNAGRTVHQGVEMALAARLMQHEALQLTARTSWTWNDFRFDNDPIYANNRLPGVPDHHVHTSLRLEHPRGFLEPQWEWVPQGTLVDYDNTFRSQGYSVLNLRAGWRPAAAWMLYADLRNLGDRTYVASVSTTSRFADQALFYPGEGRGVFVGLRWEPQP